MQTKINLKFEEEVYQKYHPLVFSTCKRFLSNIDLLEDAIQSVFLLYIKKEDSISSNLSSWFYWASVNICKVVNMEAKKHSEKSISLNENPELLEKEQSNKDLFLELGNILEKLPSKKRDMVLMRYYENMSYGEIGSYFKCKEDSVRKIIERTIAYLEVELKRKDILSGVVFAQFFGMESVKMISVSTNKFIIQNSLLQQSFVNGLQKLILVAKIKMGALIFVVIAIPLTLPLTSYLFADNNLIEENPVVIGKSVSVAPTIKENIQPIEKVSSISSPMPAGKWILYFSKNFDLKEKFIAVTLEIDNKGAVVFTSKQWPKKIPVKFSGKVGREQISFTVDGEEYSGDVHTSVISNNGKKMPPYIQAVGVATQGGNNSQEKKWTIQSYENLKVAHTIDENLW